MLCFTCAELNQECIMADVPAGKVPILESVGAAYRYLFDNWQMWLPAVVVLSALSAVIAVVNPAILIPKFEFISATQSLQSSIFISSFPTTCLHDIHENMPPAAVTSTIDNLVINEF